VSEGVKRCARCGEDKPQSAFSAGRRRCIECRREEAKEYRRRYYQKNKEKILAAKRAYESANRGAVLQYQADYRAKRKEEKAEKHQ
jgi:recombinational DNA repair protein (RecF pathway)